MGPDRSHVLDLGVDEALQVTLLFLRAKDRVVPMTALDLTSPKGLLDPGFKLSPRRRFGSSDFVAKSGTPDHPIAGLSVHPHAPPIATATMPGAVHHNRPW